MNRLPELTIDEMALDGEGQGSLDGKTVFVFGALPGERVRVRWRERNRKFAWAETEDVLTASADRVAPRCAAYGQCSGCNLMHMAYPAQLRYKRQLVQRAMRQIGGFPNVEVAPCLPSALEFGYRNKIQAPVCSAQGKARMGFYLRHSRKVLSLTGCPAHCPEGNLLYREIGALIQEHRISPYDPERKSGSLRHLLLRSAVRRSGSLVCLVSAEKNPRLFDGLARSILQRFPSVQGVVCNLNRTEGNVILGRQTFPLAGQSFVVEEIDGLLFKITATSFFQVNTAQIPALYESVVHSLQQAAHGVLVDAYCGVGLFSLLLARRARKIIGIETVPSAVTDARQNASNNQIGNVNFISGRVERILPKLEKVQAAVLNPPRSGCEPSVLRSLTQLRPERIAYVSCNPATLARDLRTLARHYRIESVRPIDLFPQTGHVETVVGLQLLSK